MVFGVAELFCSYRNHTVCATKIDVFIALWRHHHQHLRARRESRAQVRFGRIAAVGMIVYEDQFKSLKGFDLVLLQAYVLLPACSGGEGVSLTQV